MTHRGVNTVVGRFTTCSHYCAIRLPGNQMIAPPGTVSGVPLGSQVRALLRLSFTERQNEHRELCPLPPGLTGKPFKGMGVVTQVTEPE